MDPDVDLGVPARRRELSSHPAAVLGAIALGGVLGAWARAGYVLGRTAVGPGAAALGRGALVEPVTKVN
jgi:hypothetical protein